MSSEQGIKLESYVRVINYYETDQMQVVHHSNYARYLEEARLHMMDQMGLGYDKLDGKIPGCYEYDGEVTIQVKVHKSVAAKLSKTLFIIFG